MSALSAAPLVVGERFPQWTEMKDQHGVVYEIPKETKYIAVAYTMSVGKAANRYLAEQGKDFLPTAHAIFVANIYGMPGIGRFFAMPKMKKYPHRMMLADAEGLLDAFPQEDDKVTVFELGAKGEIKAITFWDPESDSKPF
ncbi:hypothetical protein [Lentimonas sp. CC4]|nr:hypothetical protein [Lentimonas sp. CC4]